MPASKGRFKVSSEKIASIIVLVTIGVVVIELLAWKKNFSIVIPFLAIALAIGLAVIVAMSIYTVLFR